VETPLEIRVTGHISGMLFLLFIFYYQVVENDFMKDTLFKLII